MSRKSQAFAEGVQKFSWALEKLPEGGYQCTCRNHPAIVGTGETEQAAMRAATVAIRDAAEKADLKMISSGTRIDPVEPSDG